MGRVMAVVPLIRKEAGKCLGLVRLKAFAIFAEVPAPRRVDGFVARRQPVPAFHTRKRRPNLCTFLRHAAPRAPDVLAVHALGCLAALKAPALPKAAFPIWTRSESSPRRNHVHHRNLALRAGFGPAKRLSHSFRAFGAPSDPRRKDAAARERSTAHIPGKHTSRSHGARSKTTPPPVASSAAHRHGTVAHCHRAMANGVGADMADSHRALAGGTGGADGADGADGVAECSRATRTAGAT